MDDPSQQDAGERAQAHPGPSPWDGAPGGPAEPPAARRLLIVDDSEDMRILLSRLARKLHPGATVQVARDAAEALGILHDAGEGEGLVVISDYDMGPGPTGTQLLAEVARRHPGARRALLTGMAPEGIVRADVEPDVVLSKDGDMRLVREFLAPRAPLTPPAAAAAARTRAAG